MTLMIPKNDWTDFIDDLSKRRKHWQTRIEKIGANIGDQTLADGLQLAGITVEERKGGTVVEILVGKDVDRHQTHSVENPQRISYLATDDDLGGILEFEESDGTKTLVHLAKPMLPAVEYEKKREITVKN